MHFISRSALGAFAAVLVMSALGAGTAFASGEKPEAETKPATKVAETGAELNGVVGQPPFQETETKYHFEYGTTTSYGKSTAEVNLGAKFTKLSESQLIWGLAAGTTYHFRIVASNINGTTDGADAMFTTLKTESLPRLEPAPKEGKGIKFTATGGVVGVYLGATYIGCSKSSMTGEFVTAKTIANTELTFSGCKAGEWSAGNKGTKETITTEPLSGELGYLSKSSRRVGLMLGKESKEVPRPLWASPMQDFFRGSPLEYGPLLGERIGEITPVNKGVTSGQGFTLAVLGSGEGFGGSEPTLTKFEGGLEEQRLYWYEGGAEKKQYKIDIDFTEELKFTLTTAEIQA